MPNGQILRSSPSNAGDPSLNLAANSTDGVASAAFKMLDGVTGNDPGYWVPWAPFHRGGLQVTATDTFTGNIKIKVSNNELQPFNTVRLTIGGTPKTGDILLAQINCDSFMNGVILAQYTVKAGDNLAAVTAGLLAAINAAIFAQVQALNDTQQVNLAASIFQAITNSSDTIDLCWQYPLEPLTVTTAVAGTSPTTTLAGAPYDDGTGFDLTGGSLTSTGFLSFDVCATWIKTYVSGFSTTGTPAITAIIQACIP